MVASVSLTCTFNLITLSLLPSVNSSPRTYTKRSVLLDVINVDTATLLSLNVRFSTFSNVILSLFNNDDKTIGPLLPDLYSALYSVEAPDNCIVSVPLPPSTVSWPLLAMNKSLPPLPSNLLLTLLPRNVSLPLPPMAFSIMAFLAIEIFFVILAASEKCPSRKSILDLVEKPDKSSVSLPPASQIVTIGLVFFVKSNASLFVVLLNPYVSSPVRVDILAP